MTLFETDTRRALDARTHAQWIAFAPFVFQAARVLWTSGLLARIEAAGPEGVTIEALAADSDHSPYALRVLLESALGSGLLTLKDGRYATTRTAWFLLHDPMTQSSMRFTHDVCYRGLYDLDTALATGTPSGLATLSEADTVYDALAGLPPHVRESWLAFDHYYSDLAFPHALRHLARHGVRRLLDIGGNTGKFATLCVQAAPPIRVSIVDLPGQLGLARQAIDKLGPQAAERVGYHAANLLDPHSPLPTAHDAAWMSQFLSCFGEDDILSILRRAATALPPDGLLFVQETLWDRQKQPVAAFCLQQTSLYFTAIANGRSRMYTSDVLLDLMDRAGFELVEDLDGIGIVHTLLIARKRDAS